MAPFGLALDGETIAHIPSDGVIVATPTGSTGYFLSAGGPIIHPAVDALGVAALLPHTLFARPLIVPSDADDPDHLRRRDRAAPTSRPTATSPPSCAPATGSRSAAPSTRSASRASRTGAFFKRLEDKLQWGVPIKLP